MDMEMDMNLAWLTFPLMLTGSRDFECGDLTTDECDYYMQRWHFWYIADHVFALPTVAFFMTTIGIFTVGHIVNTVLLRRQKSLRSVLLGRGIAAIRFLSYRGYHVKLLGWNSASVGILLLGVAGMMFFFGMDLAPQPYYWPDEMFGDSPPLATRSGWMALACMPFLFATATKTSWITLLTGVSHERLQVFHRWIAYAFFVLALLHTFPFIVYHIHWKDMQEHFANSLLFYWTGIVALIFQTWLTFMSHSTIRNLGYEFFKVAHFAAVVVFMITFFWHCDYTLTSWHYFIATAAVYVPCFILPWLRTIFEYGGSTPAYINVEENGFTRITIPTVCVAWTPGQHCFLRFTGFGILNAISAHPFTICSSPARSKNDPSELVFYIRHRKGLTAKLYNYALEHPGLATSVVIDGPYGGVSTARLHSTDHLLVIAGGSGAGWILPFIEWFIATSSSDSGFKDRSDLSVNDKQVASSVRPLGDHPPSSLRVVLATRDAASRVWFERTVAELLARFPETETSTAIEIRVYVTGSAAQDPSLSEDKMKSSAGAPIGSTDSTARDGRTFSTSAVISACELKGRPPLETIIKQESARAAASAGSLGVYVCGPSTMNNDVRNAVAAENWSVVSGKGGAGVYLHSEHFGWA